MTYHRTTNISSEGGWKKRQEKAAEKLFSYKERLENDPEFAEVQRQRAAEATAMHEAEQARKAEIEARKACQCCGQGSYAPVDLHAMSKAMIRAMGRDAVDAILSEHVAPVAQPEAPAVPADLARIVQAAVTQALAANPVILQTDETESTDPDRDPAPDVPARRGPGRPRKVPVAA